MELVRVLPSADDEINAACFHPRPGGGIAYGTKEGRLRVIAVDRSALAEEPEAAEVAASTSGGSSGGASSSQRACGRAGAGAAAASGGAVAGEEAHPTQRELDSLRDWMVTQQWLQQQALGGGAPPLGWERGGRRP